jgi:hypothetical protein
MMNQDTYYWFMNASALLLHALDNGIDRDGYDALREARDSLCLDLFCRDRDLWRQAGTRTTAVACLTYHDARDGYPALDLYPGLLDEIMSQTGCEEPTGVFWRKPLAAPMGDDFTSTAVAKTTSTIWAWGQAEYRTYQSRSHDSAAFVPFAALYEAIMDHYSPNRWVKTAKHRPNTAGCPCHRCRVKARKALLARFQHSQFGGRRGERDRVSLKNDTIYVVFGDDAPFFRLY